LRTFGPEDCGRFPHGGALGCRLGHRWRSAAAAGPASLRPRGEWADSGVKWLESAGSSSEAGAGPFCSTGLFDNFLKKVNTFSKKVNEFSEKLNGFSENMNIFSPELNEFFRKMNTFSPELNGFSVRRPEC
jgi:hypothetical protein